MQRNFIHIVLLICVLGFGKAAAQEPFIENKGQWPGVVEFRTLIPGGQLYVENNALLFNLFDTETTDRVFAAHSGSENPIEPPRKLDCHAYRMKFIGAQKGAAFAGSDMRREHYNFFLGDDPDRWAGGASAFSEVRQSEIYPGIDLKIYRKGALKYDFILAPFADASAIEIAYDGVKPRLTDKGQLLLKTNVGEVLESKPFAYQYYQGQLKPVSCSYKVDKNTVTFELGTYDRSPWGGGEGAGALAGTDIAISKFSLDGTALEYSTYIGGGGDELPHSIVVDSPGNLYVFGTTGSADYPTTDNAYQTEFLGGESTVLGGIGVFYSEGADIVVSALNSDGSDLLGSTYIGGEENDGTNTNGSLKYNYADEVRGEIEINPDGNIVVGTTTFSVDFPMVENGYQTELNSGQEAVLFVMNPSMSQLLHASFFGGAGADAFYSIHIDEDGIITTGGGTTSSGIPTTPDAFQPSFAGGAADGMIATFNAELETLEAATYYGTSAYDQIYFVERDGFGNPHIFGQTEATGTTLIENADYANPGTGMLVANFNTDLSGRIWSTVFGSTVGVPNLSPTAFSVDICNRIYLSGWGGTVNDQGNTNGLDVSDDALQPTTDGSDFYFLVLDGDANDITYASFFGGNISTEHVDGGTSRFDRAGKIYQAVCAGCGSNDDFPIEPENAHSPTNNSTNCNLGVAKIDFDLPLVLADFEVSPVCFPDSVELENTSSTYSGSDPTYQWLFSDGQESTETNPTVLLAPGNYEVTLIVSDPNSCNISDTIVKDVEVFPTLFADVPPFWQSCETDTAEISVSHNGTVTNWQWATDSNFSNIISAGPTDSVLVYPTEVVTSIFLSISNGFCDKTYEIDLYPAPKPELSIGDTTLCNISEIEVSASVISGYEISDILWTPEDQIISGQGTNTVLVDLTNPVELSASLVATAPGIAPQGSDCEASLSADLVAYDIELQVPGDTLICANEELDLIANSSGTAENFIWSTDPDFTTVLNEPGDSSITVLPDTYTVYYALVNNDICTIEDSVGVSLLSAGTSVSADQYICAGDTAMLVVSNDFPGSQLTHQWEPADLIVSGQGSAVAHAVVTEVTTFDVVSTTPEGCEVANEVTVFTSPLGLENIDATADPQNITVGESSQLQALPENDEYTYQWEPPTYLDVSFGDSPTSTPPETITYLVTISDIGDIGICSRVDSVTIFVYEDVCGEPNIFVPNTFTPNSDGENDLLLVRGGNITDMNFSVFNRWGEKVFETTDQSEGWDGTYKNNLAEPAVFVYHLDVRCGDGQTYFKKGNVTLVR
ncbi:MAG: gliding motility-associated C-terminal domain-containing protein [Flavobacteriales bacterium]|nr:gliding motility-associated C-terminal domain-containing protein [Flavobacteriales bacterium]